MQANREIHTIVPIGDLTSCYYTTQVPPPYTTETNSTLSPLQDIILRSKLPSGNASHIRYFDPMLQRFIRGM